MSRLAQHAPAVVVLITVLVVGGMVFGQLSSGEFKQRVEQETAESKAYCQQVYGDSSVYTANVVGNHGGLHCVANEKGPHLHAIPEKFERQAYEASQNGEDLGWDVATAAKHAEQSNYHWYDDYLAVLPATLAIAAVVLLIGFVRRWRLKREVRS